MIPSRQRTAALPYAAYGSNLHPLRLQARTSSARLVGTGYLPDWSLHFHKRSLDASAKCSIQQGSSGVYVAVYRMSEADKLVLDEIEGVGKGYVDAEVVVPGIGVCSTYLAADTHVDEDLRPYDWYRELVLLGCRHLALPRDYVRRIAATAALPDPDPDRRLERWKLVETLRDSLCPGENWRPR